MGFRGLFLVLLLWQSPTGGPQLWSKDDFLRLLSAAVVSADSVVRADAPSEWANGPLLLDVESVVQVARDERPAYLVTPDDVRRTVGAPYPVSFRRDSSPL